MLDWLKKMSCVSSHEEMLHGGISANNINRFKVFTDRLLTSESLSGQGVRSGILEVNDDELVHYQKNAEPIKWSYRCLRRYGLGNNTILFESGRRCSTGPGLFAFRCAQADILHNIFTEKLRRFASNRNGTIGSNSLHRTEFVSAQAPNRYSNDMMITSNMAASQVVEEPYLTPLSSNQNYANGDIINGQTQSYVNCASTTLGSTSDTEYVNTIGAGIETETRQKSAAKVKSSNVMSGGAAIRELNYADLDLPQSTAVSSQAPCKFKAYPLTDNLALQYINLQHNSDEEADDDDAFLPESAHTLSVDMVGQRVESTPNHSSTVGYMNLPNGQSAKKISTPLPSNPSNTQYTTIDFQKTAAIASTAKSTQSESTQEGVRKTRHDSSADNLN